MNVCIEQMNGELNKEIEVTVRTSQIGTTATGISSYMCVINIHTLTV